MMKFRGQQIDIIGGDKLFIRDRRRMRLWRNKIIQSLNHSTAQSQIKKRCINN